MNDYLHAEEHFRSPLHQDVKCLLCLPMLPNCKGGQWSDTCLLTWLKYIACITQLHTLLVATSERLDRWCSCHLPWSLGSGSFSLAISQHFRETESATRGSLTLLRRSTAILAPALPAGSVAVVRSRAQNVTQKCEMLRFPLLVLQHTVHMHLASGVVHIIRSKCIIPRQIGTFIGASWRIK